MLMEEIVAGMDLHQPERYYGLYCEQCGTWYKQRDGHLVFYPAPEITSAMLNDRLLDFYADHPWKVQEFGKEEYVPRENLKPNTQLCSVVAQKTITLECVVNERRA